MHRGPLQGWGRMSAGWVSRELTIESADLYFPTLRYRPAPAVSAHLHRIESGRAARCRSVGCLKVESDRSLP